MLVPTYATVLLSIQLDQLNTGFIPNRWYCIFVIGTFLLTFIIPFTAMLLYWRGDISRAYMSERHSRNIPYAYSVVSAVLWYFFLRKVLCMPPIICTIAIGAIVSLFLISLINLRWKISAHLTMLGALLGAALAYGYYTGFFAYWTWLGILLASWIVMWARLYLNEHTEIQVVVGYLTGLIVTFTIGLTGAMLL